MAVDTQQIHGFDELIAKLKAITPALRKRVLRNALAAGARVVRDDAKRNAPVLSGATRAPYRTPGLMRKAISVRTSKVARRSGDVGVFVNVRPAKSGQRGAKSKTDPYYWSFINFGTQKMRATPFLTNAALRFPEALRIFEERVRKWFKQTNDSGKVLP